MNVDIKEVNNIKYFIKNKNDVIQNCLYNGVQWNNEIIETIKFLVEKKGLKHLVNIGAHIGSVAIPLSRHIDKVTAIEAYKPTFVDLNNNIELNDIENIKTLNVAVGDTKETIHFLRSDIDRIKNNTGGMHVITEMDKKYNMRSSELVDNTFSCEMYPFDEIDGIEKFDIILVDIEGMDARFLQGAKNKILKNKPIIIIEIWSNEKRKEEKMLISREGVINRIIELGYTLYKNIKDDYIFLPN